MPETVDNTELQNKLKSSLWYHVGQMVDDATLDAGTNATTQFTGSLTELVWAQLENIATDMESFAKHAGRSTVKTDDVLLLARRNEGLEQHLRDKLESLKREKQHQAISEQADANDA